jgi:cell division protein FtsN
MRMMVPAAVMVMMVAAMPAGAATVKDGVDAWQHGDYAAAVGIWRPLADQGDGDAAFNLAQAYKLGRGVPTDLNQAKALYGKAARAGHAQGAANYGLLLFQDGDRKAAMPWIEKASTAGDPRAQYVLGTALFNGDLATRDWPRAYALMTRAAAAGLPQATTSLSQMDQFLGTPDKQKGLQLAADMASKPVPPIGRHLVTDAGEIMQTPIVAPPTPRRNIQPVELPPSRPIPPPVAVAAARPVAKPIVQKAPAPIAVASVGGKWQVQLGAYGSQAAARTAWAGIAGKAAGLRGLSPSFVPAGAVFRLRAGPLADKAGADKACAAAKGAGAACFPVAP